MGRKSGDENDKKLGNSELVSRYGHFSAKDGETRNPDPAKPTPSAKSPNEEMKQKHLAMLRESFARLKADKGGDYLQGVQAEKLAHPDRSQAEAHNTEASVARIFKQRP